MNEYIRGAFEALAWVQTVIEKQKMTDKHPSRWESLNEEIEEAIRDIRKGISVDFRERLRAIT